MLIKNIKIAGFKGIDSEVSIPLAPITLLFGGNSSGKSTILQAFLYLYESIIHNNCDPVRSSKQGDGCLLNGFQNLVHKKDLHREISIEVELDLENTILDSYLSSTDELLISEYDNRTDKTRSFELNEPDIKSASVRFDIAHSESNGAYIKAYSVFIEGKLFAKIVNEKDSPQVWLIVEQDRLEDLNSIYGDETPGQVVAAGIDSWKFVTLDRVDTAMPSIDKGLQISEKNWGHDSTISNNPVVGKIYGEAILSQLIVAPLKVLVNELEHLLHLGPVRTVPSRGYVPNKYPENWYSGTAAWDKFAYSSTDFHAKVNEAFSCAGFDSKYEFILGGEYKNILIRDKELNITHEPAELGIGLSQIFPFIVAIADKKSSFVSVEQPELHIHPGWQLIIGDLLIKAIKEEPRRLFLIETHSEHLMLRLLNRVRLHESEEKLDELIKIKPEDLSVICVYANEGKPYYQQQKVTGDGDFEIEWPEGFFEERYEEL